MFEKKSKLVLVYYYYYLFLLNQKMLTCAWLELETIGAPPGRAGRWAWRIEAGLAFRALEGAQVKFGPRVREMGLK